MPITMEKYLATLNERFGGVLRSGAHEPDGQACALEAYAVATGVPWTDDPPTLGMPDVRRLNDARWSSDQVRTEGLAPVRREARRDFDRGGRYGYDRERYGDRWDACNEAYTEEFDRLRREDDRRREEREEQEAAEARLARRQREEREAEEAYLAERYAEQEQEPEPSPESEQS